MKWSTRLLSLCLAMGHIVVSSPETAAAEPLPETTWLAWKERTVVIEKSDGTSVTGELIAVKEKAVVLFTSGGDAVVVSRDEVTAARLVDEAGAAKSAPQPAKKPPPADTEPAEPTPSGRLHVRIESNEPLLELHQDMGTYGSVGGFGSTVVWNSLSRVLCRTPCGVMVDGRNGQRFYLMAHNQRIGPSFELPDRPGAVALRATFERFVSPTMKQAGSLLTVGGGVALVPAIMFTGLGETKRDEGMKVAGGVSFGIAAAALAVGIPLLVVGRGSYDLDLPQSGAHDLPRFAGAGLTLPLPNTDGTIEARVGASWTF